MTTYIYNEHDENQVQSMRRKLKKKKRKRRGCLVIIALFLAFLLVFFFSDMSKVKKITVTGCKVTSQETIVEQLPIKSKQTYFFKVNKKQIAKQIENMIFVEKATVSKDLIGNIKINIKENNASLYGYVNNILYVADQDGVIEQDQQQKWLSYVQRCPQMMNFDEEHFQSFVQAYVKLPSVVQNQISSVVFEPDEKDQTKCKLELDDGKVFYVRIEDMEKQLTSTNYYLVIQSYPDYKYYDFLGKNVYVYN